MLKTRREATIYFEQEIDVTHTLEFLREINQEQPRDKRKSLFHIVLAAAGRTIALRPQINRFVSGQRLYQRNQILLNFIAKIDFKEGSDELNVPCSFDPYDTIDTLSQKVVNEITQAREAGNSSSSEVDFLVKLPRGILSFIFKSYRWLDFYNLLPGSLIKTDPCYSSMFFTNVGSIGLEAPYHFLFEHGTTGIFLSIGVTKKTYVLNKKGEVEKKIMTILRYSYDDRISDGVYMAKTLRLIKDLIEKPEKLTERPEISQKILDELQLKGV